MPRFGLSTTAQPHCPPLDLVTGMNRTWNYLCIFFNIALSETYRAQLFDKTRSAMMLCAELSAADPTYASDPGVQDAVAAARAWEATAALLGTDAFAKLGEHFAELTEARRVVHDRPGVAAAEVGKRVRQLYSLDEDVEITTPHLDAEIVLTDLAARYDAAFRSLWSQDPISYLTSLTTADAPVAEARLLFDIVESMDKEGLMDHDALFPEDDDDDESGSSTSWAPRSHAQARDDAIAFERMRWEQCLARARERCMSVELRRREWARVRVQEVLDGGAGLAAWRRERSR
ncbi:hypothetical protein Q8F55_006060 [Vanrija albida]|uniref:Uncharacterized protein n=1 Tax=Vanrija albida TaxID=181172 RepID=A0ABR3Q3P5_9TREE